MTRYQRAFFGCPGVAEFVEQNVDLALYQKKKELNLPPCSEITQNRQFQVIAGRLLASQA